MLLVAESLTKRYRRITAVDGVSLGVDRGEILGFLGPNGAGKTTTLRILAGYLSPDAGRVALDGVDVLARPLEARRRVGYLPENVPLYGEMRVGEYLRHRARLKGMSGRDAARRAGEVAALCRVDDVMRRPIATLSKGYRQRVGLADALLHRPPLLLLDEPAAGLDPNQIRELRGLLRDLARDHAVLLSTHILSEVEPVCSRVAILLRGRVVAEDTPAGLRARLKAEGLRVVVGAADVARARDALGDGAEVVDAAAGILHTGLDAAAAARRLLDGGIAFSELGRDERTLEDAFIEVTR